MQLSPVEYEIAIFKAWRVSREAGAIHMVSPVRSDSVAHEPVTQKIGRPLRVQTTISHPENRGL